MITLIIILIWDLLSSSIYLLQNWNDWRFGCHELETTLGVREQELALKGREASHRERVLLTNLDSARLRIKLLQVQHHGSVSDDDDGTVEALQLQPHDE